MPHSVRPVHPRESVHRTWNSDLR